MRPTRTLFAVLAAGTLLAPALATLPATAAPTPRYVALGDSYASGEGQAPYQDGTDTATNGCHRSKKLSYPALLDGVGLPAYTNLTSVACSGAFTASLVASVPDRSDEAPQLAAVTPGTTKVTLTIGGNDAGFSTVLGGCVYGVTAKARIYAKGEPGCRDVFEPVVAPRVAALSGRKGAPKIDGVVPIPQLLGAIQAQAPGATIVVTGYPRLFGSTMTDANGCRVSPVLPAYIRKADVAWLRSTSNDLNVAIQDGVRLARKAGAKVRYVHPATLFKNHNLCDKGKSWINPLLVDPATASVQPASFHPNEIGQVAYAVSVGWPGTKLPTGATPRASLAVLADTGR